MTLLHDAILMLEVCGYCYGILALIIGTALILGLVAEWWSPTNEPSREYVRHLAETRDVWWDGPQRLDPSIYDQERESA